MEGRDKNGKFAKNNKISTGKNQNPEVEELRVALTKALTKRGISILEHFVDRAYENDKVLIAVMKKLIADKTHVDAKIDSKRPLLLKIINDSSGFKK